MSLGGHIHVLNPQLPAKKQDDYIKHTQAGIGLRLKQGAGWTDQILSAPESNSYFS